MAELRLVELEKRFPDGTVALDRVSLDAVDGELLVLVGPSGCGKSTALRVVAGLERPSAGQVWIGAREVTRLPPQERDVAMVFQSYALYPHKSVRDNLAFGLRVRGAAAATIARKVAEVAETLELTPLLGRRPGELSGGQRQRVALGRAIVRAPQLFLLDEPLSNLDARLRLQTRAELAQLSRRLGTTMVYVTHDQEEAMTLGHRIAVMRAGRVEQVGAPLEVFQRPASVFVAGFLGAPPMSFLAGEVTAAAGETRVRGPGFSLRVDGDAALPPRLVVGIRPHDLALAPISDGDLHGKVEWLEALGRDVVLHVRLDAATLVRVLVPPEDAPAAGATVSLRLRADRLHLFDEATGRRVDQPARRTPTT
jgi:multiple sugar transport system ATP-binding protein